MPVIWIPFSFVYKTIVRSCTSVFLKACPAEWSVAELGGLGRTSQGLGKAAIANDGLHHLGSFFQGGYGYILVGLVGNINGAGSEY